MSAPEKEASSVKMAGTFSSLYIAIRAVDSFDLCIEKRQDSKLKKSHSLDNMKGNSLLLAWSKGLTFEFPYINTFFFLEWPCRSM